MNYKISHPTGSINCEIDLPSSKSISNRLLIIQSLCKKEFEIQNLSTADDTKTLQKALNFNSNLIDIGAAGTSFRFLTAYLSTKVGKEFTLTGSERMKERPIKILVDILNKMGADISYQEKEGFPPLKIKGAELTGGKIEIDGTISSQFISALLLIAPTLKEELNLCIKGELVSTPYVQMTLKLMEEFGISYSWEKNIIKIKPQDYLAKNYKVESDWSAASFWFEIASLSKDCNIILNGLFKNSIQGDKRIMELSKDFGVNSLFEKDILTLTKNKSISTPKTIDLLETPDLYQPLKCMSFGLERKISFKGTSTLKHKETNRIDAVNNELKKLQTSKLIDTYKDHRMAMSFAPLCLKFGDLQIHDANVVTKSYPKFWEDLKKGGFKISPLTETNN